MKDVNIYIYTEYEGSLKSGTGKYHVILETTIQDQKGKTIPWTNMDGKNPIPIMGAVENITKNRLELLALDSALSYLNKRSARVIIHTASEYITGAFAQDWTDKWERNNYKSKGKAIKHADLWKSIIEKVNKYDVTFMQSAATSYTKMQENELKKLSRTIIPLPAKSKS